LNVPTVQADLGIEVILELFSKEGLINLFKVESLKLNDVELSDNSSRILALQDDYIKTIDSVISFLQGKNPTLALQICQGDYLPEASRFNQIEEMDWAFGTMGKNVSMKILDSVVMQND